MEEKVEKKADNPEEETASEREEKQEEKPEETDKPEETPSESSEERQMFKTTCSDCGKETEVPFEPEEGREIYCKECYQKRRPRRRSFGRFGGRRRDNERPREMHKATCSKCGKEAEVPFKPDGRKPILCKECFIKQKEAQ